MERETAATQPVPEMITPPTESSVVGRVRDAITDAWDRFSHPVSREAEAELRAITTQLEGTPVATTLDQVAPHLRGLLRGADQAAMAYGLFWRGVSLGIGSGFLISAIRNKNLNGSERFISGFLGAIGIAGGINSRPEGVWERTVIGNRASRLNIFYATDAGKTDAANPDKTTAQVDNIVRAITAGFVPSISKP